MVFSKSLLSLHILDSWSLTLNAKSSILNPQNSSDLNFEYQELGFKNPVETVNLHLSGTVWQLLYRE